MWTWYDSEIIKIINETERVKRFWLKVNTETVFTFKPGQFITLDLPIHKKRLQRWRSYSIASIPNKDNIIELCIVLLEKGLGTTYLFKEAPIGTKIKFKGASGVFILPEKIEKDLLFICTGTGIAPFRSMIQTLLTNNFSYNIDLVFGTRHHTDILYLKEWQSLLKKYNNFNFHIALSREKDITAEMLQVSSVYNERYVHDVYSNLILKNKTISAFLCGWNIMLDEAKPKLLELGLTENQIILESYG